MPVTEGGQLNTATVVAACLAISGESTMDGLAATVLRLALEGCGALEGYLILMEGGSLKVIASGKRGDGTIQRAHYPPLPHMLPLSLIESVRSSRRIVVLEDLSAPHPFSTDQYLSARNAGSAACLPVVRDGGLSGALYLERDSAAGAFPPASISLLEIIAAQTAIALEHILATEKFKGLLESAPDAMVIVDSTGKIVMINSQTERLFGYRREELLGNPVLILVPERYRDRHRNHVTGYMRNPRIRPMGQGLDLLGLRKDGSEFPVDISLSPFSTNGGILVTAAIRDVTERKRAENALRLAEEKYRSIFENAVEGIFCVSPDGKLIEANAALAQMLGYPSPRELMELNGDLAGRLQLTPQQLTAAHSPLAEGSVKAIEAEVPRRDGSVITVSARVTGVHDNTGALQHYEGVVENITERKKAEEALRFSEARYRTLFRDNPTMIFTLDDDFRILTANPFAATQLGYTEDELEGISLISRVHEEDRHLVEAQLRRCLEDPSKAHVWQFRKVCKSGKVLWVEELGQAVCDLNGKLTVMVVCLDITERRDAEMALKESEQKYRQLSQTLEERVRNTVDELRQKDKMLIVQSRQAVMGEMISNIAHQWRQPLNTLALLAQERHYIRTPEQLSSEAAHTNFNKMMQTINHMSKTIDDFRNFFRPEKEKIPFKVREAVERTLNLIEGSLRSSEVKVEVHSTGDPEVVGFPNEFSQVLVNILINARDAFVAAQDRVENPTVTIDLFEEGELTVLTVTDNAGGMPGWVLEKIFEPYFTTKGPDKGTGVGLFMCKNIIEKSMNGRLSARNVDGGAQFRIEL